jgi:hypothetical protein
VKKLAQLLDNAHAHRDHRTAGSKRRNDIVALFQRQASSHRNRFLSFARKSLRRMFPLMLPANQRLFEHPRRQHVGIESPFDAVPLILIIRTIS